MILEEDYKNLNMIDRSIIRGIDLSHRDLDFSMDSEISVDKVFDVDDEGKKVNHTFSKIIDILNQDDVSAIVFRASRKQLCLIGKEGLQHAMKKSYEGDVVIILSSFIYDKVEDMYNMNRVMTSSLERVKSIIKTLFEKAYPDDYVGKKVWDIIVIKKDSKKDLRREREDSQKGIVELPGKDGSAQRAKYQDQLRNLAQDFQEKLILFKDKKMKNINFPDDVMKLFTNDKNMQNIKFNGKVYRLRETSVPRNEQEIKLDLFYQYDNRRYDPIENVRETILAIQIGFNGIYPYVDKVYLAPNTYSYGEDVKYIYKKEE